MRVALVTHRWHLPFFSGGAEYSAHEVLRWLVGAGHRVHVYSGPRPGMGRAVRPGSITRSLRRWGVPFASTAEATCYETDCVPVCMGMTETSTLPSALLERLRSFKPTVVLTQCEGAEEVAQFCVGQRIPVVVMIRSVAEIPQPGDWSRAAHFVTVSNYMRQRLLSEAGLAATVLPPPISKDRVLVQSGTAESATHITLVNPIPRKGGELLLSLASRSTERRFMAVEGWYWPVGYRARLRTMPNILAVPRMRAMSEVFRRTRILLMPSDQTEAFGRVAVEAMLNGIPVLATPGAGIREATQGAAVYVSSSDVDAAPEWESALRLLDDDASYRLWSQRGLNAGRQCLPEAVGPRWERYLLEVADSC